MPPSIFQYHLTDPIKKIKIKMFPKFQKRFVNNCYNPFSEYVHANFCDFSQGTKSTPKRLSLEEKQLALKTPLQL